MGLAQVAIVVLLALRSLPAQLAQRFGVCQQSPGIASVITSYAFEA